MSPPAAQVVISVWRHTGIKIDSLFCFVFLAPLGEDWPEMYSLQGHFGDTGASLMLSNSSTNICVQAEPTLSHYSVDHHSCHYFLTEFPFLRCRPRQATVEYHCLKCHHI